MSDDDALKYAEEFNIPMPELKDASAANDQDAIAQQLQQVAQAPIPGAMADAASRKGAARKRKTDTPAGIPDEDTSKVAPASPDKKRRRTSGKVDDSADKKSRGKKTK